MVIPYLWSDYTVKPCRTLSGSTAQKSFCISHFLTTRNRLHSAPMTNPWVPKNKFKQFWIREGRGCKETIVQPWGRVLIPLQVIHRIFQRFCRHWVYLSALPTLTRYYELSGLNNRIFFFLTILRSRCWHMWGESKLVKMVCSDSLTPHFVNNDYVTAEIIYSTAHAHHEVLDWSQAICAVGICELHLKYRGTAAV